MTSVSSRLPAIRRLDLSVLAPWLTAGVLFAILFAQPARLLVRDWWSDPEAGHGLLLGPLALWLAWRTGLHAQSSANPVPGGLTMAAAVLLRFLSGLAAELFTMRLSMVLAVAGLVIYVWGFRQLVRWWLPFTILLLSIPIPAVILNTLALPLQFRASAMGAALLEFRHVPVRLAGNVIDLPGQRLFVTEACSGLRSLTALLSLGVLVGGLWLRHPLSRVFIIGLSIPIAIGINAIRVFLTGFLVYFVDPKLGEGFMHLTEGWLMFLVALGLLGLAGWAVNGIERRLLPERGP